MSKSLIQINAESRATVKQKYPDAYFDARLGGIFYRDEATNKDKVLAYGKTCNSAWYNAADEIKSQHSN